MTVGELYFFFFLNGVKRTWRRCWTVGEPSIWWPRCQLAHEMHEGGLSREISNLWRIIRPIERKMKDDESRRLGMVQVRISKCTNHRARRWLESSILKEVKNVWLPLPKKNKRKKKKDRLVVMLNHFITCVSEVIFVHKFMHLEVNVHVVLDKSWFQNPLSFYYYYYFLICGLQNFNLNWSNFLLIP